MARLAAFALALLLTIQLRADSEGDLQRRIDDAIKAGGGDVVIPAGEQQIERGLVLASAKKVRLVAAERGKTILRLGPLRFAQTTVTAAAGSSEIRISRAQELVIGMELKIEADGEIDSFTNKPRPFQLAKLKASDDTRLVLEAPLKFPVPAGTLIRDQNAPNLITVRGASENVSIDGLVLDGGRIAGDPPVRGHAQLCGIFAAGPYKYDKGPTAPLLQGIQVTNCVIRNCFGRGVAFYCVEDGLVEDCVVSGSNDEAIDLDHFTIRTTVRHNRVQSCIIGIEINDANDCLIEDNEIRGCRTGLSLWRYCKQPGLNERNRIARNRFLESSGNAIQIQTGTRSNHVVDNQIVGAGRNGISLAGSNQSVVGNRISEVKLKPIAVQEGAHTLRDND